MDIRDSQRIKEIRDNTRAMAEAFSSIASTLADALELYISTRTETKTETQNSNLTFEKAEERCKACNHYKLTCDLFSEICNYEPKDEPQTDAVGVPMAFIDEAKFKAHCLNCQRDVADIKCLDCDGDKYFLPDEPQTERSE